MTGTELNCAHCGRPVGLTVMIEPKALLRLLLSEPILPRLSVHLRLFKRSGWYDPPNHSFEFDSEPDSLASHGGVGSISHDQQTQHEADQPRGAEAHAFAPLGCLTRKP